MSMVDEEDDYYVDENGDVWCYVEENYDEAEDLAEHSCPSPAYQQGMTTDDYDVYDIWEDLEYMTDAYYDTDDEQGDGSKTERRKRKMEQAPEPRTRKRRASDNGDRVSKRHKGVTDSKRMGTTTQSAGQVMSAVLWVPHSERSQSPKIVPPSSGRPRAVTLLKDWRETCPPQTMHTKLTKQSDGHQAKTKLPNSNTTAPPSVIKAKKPTVDEDEELSADPDEINDGQKEEFSLDMSSVAGMLSKEQLDAVRAQLREKGLDPSALEMVLQDMIEGKEREFDDEEDGEDEDDGAEEDERSRR